MMLECDRMIGCVVVSTTPFTTSKRAWATSTTMPRRFSSILPAACRPEPRLPPAILGQRSAKHRVAIWPRPLLSKKGRRLIHGTSWLRLHQASPTEASEHRCQGSLLSDRETSGPPLCTHRSSRDPPSAWPRSQQGRDVVGGGSDTFQVASVPEPSTMLILTTGLALLVLLHRKRFVRE
ncbi:MAG: PEP-CTERM sorting domain-containing protein [Actinobacteria bacterium]|nr:MAG: PEP-CTERM sorting domain-containing protein [Actinomycetota bacterium]